MIICTITAANHLAFAKLLGKSLKEHVTGCKFVLCLVENDIHPDAASFAEMDDVVLVKDLRVPGFEQLIAEKDIYQFTALLKPYLMLHLFDRYPEENKFVFMDADTRVYGSFEQLEELLERYSIVLTPHRLEPQNHLNSVEEELVNLKDGAFQVGFLGLSHTAESRRFLQWWAARCLHYAVVDYGRGLFGDQKWLNLVPCFFKGVYILRDPGYHMASWNLSQRNLECGKNNQYTVNGRPFVFFHFSGIGKWLDKSIRLHADKNDNVKNLVNQYIYDLHEMGHSQFMKIPWDFEKIMRYEERQQQQTEMETQPVPKPIVEARAADSSQTETASAPEEKIAVQSPQKIYWLFKIWDKIKAVFI